MMTREQGLGIGAALNEASLLGFEVNAERRVAGATFAVLTLPDEGPVPDDRRVQLILRPVGRVIASLRLGRWDDPNAEVLSVALAELLGIVQSFGGQPVYGWDCVDVHERALAEWGDRLSLDWTSGVDGRSHSLTLFQEGADRILDLCVWFDELEIRDPQGTVISLDSFIAGGKRWWDALYAGDDRTKGYGIFPLKGPAA